LVHVILTVLVNHAQQFKWPAKADFFSTGTTAPCGLWPVEQYPSILSYLSPALSIFSLLALEDLFLLPLSIFSWVFPYVSSLPVVKIFLGILSSSILSR
jgi:hypothetical protein